jgi:TetR/AcrR family transcriptional regulator, cholesterol catabolism regulator
MTTRKNRRLGRPANSDGAKTRQRILDVAQRQLSTKGYAGTTLRSIADEAGITSIHHYFPSKAELVSTILTEAAEFTLAQSEHVAASDLPIAEKFSMLVREATHVYEERPGLAAFATSVLGDAVRYSELSDGLRTNRRAVNRFYAKLVDDAAAAGLRDAADRQGLIDLFAGLNHGLGTLAATSLERHRHAAERMSELIEGTLITARRAGA